TPHHIVTFHYYHPFQFTHQGAEWADGSAAWLGVTWEATEAQQQEVTSNFDSVAAWAEAHNVPVLLGEFGAYSKADMPSRARWTNFVAREAEARGFAWTYWEFCAGFGVYNPATRQWNEPLLKALIP
ncbi:MAG: glycoside hydrolase family 5 protein, partial [Chloroflexi bacterium]